jgi:hypothetical protein
MRPTNIARLAGLCLAVALPLAAGEQAIETYAGACDASAGASLDADHFVAGNDETNALHYYRRGETAPTGTLSLTDFLGAGRNEVDIEGAAAIGSRVYWITSHGRDAKGRYRPGRHRLFATEIAGSPPPGLRPVGRPYVDLLRDLVDADALKPYRLDAASRLAAEAEGGLNIEGLAATPDGGLLIGFRNPLRAGRALVVPLRNPAEVVEGQRARFGPPIELDLERKGIRSIERVGAAYRIVAGPTADRGSFALYDWSGKADDPPVPVLGVALGTLRPEALFAVPDTAQVQLLSDDGGVRVAGVECKQREMSRQAFRSLTATR